MAHKFDTGFSVREVPWHGLGNVLLEQPENWAAARTAAGLEWDPIEVPVYEVGELYADGRASVSLVEDFKQVKRSDTGDRLAIVKDGYELITHDVFGEIFEAILDSSDGAITYETAGSLDGGKKVWVLAKMGGEIHLPGDPSASIPYLALMTSHDGSAALRVVGTMIRIVCMNTWHAADVDSTKRGSTYSFRHTKNWRNRVEDAKQALAATQESIDHTVTQAKEMLRQQVTAEQARWFIREFAVHRVVANTVGKQPHGKKQLADRMEQPRVKAALDHTIASLHRIMDSETTLGIRGNMWGLVQAAGEFADHLRDSNSRESYFARTVLSDREPLKLAAVRLAREALINA
jgi:phage/plasmid-like protein (TIGR03299 family)